MNDKTYRYCPLCRTELTTAERGGKPRLECPACGFVQRRNPVPVVAAVVERDGHVILVHSIGRPPTWFGLVAGFLEQGEHPEAAVLREVDEELGLPAKLESMVGIYPFELFNQIIFVYHVRAGAGTIKLDASELDAYKEVPFAKLRPWPRGTGPGLRDWLATRGFHPDYADFGTAIYD
jgi:NADH pyrophosphatase NudC (nudix superfamily)